MDAVVELSCVEAWREVSELIDGTLDGIMRSRMELHLRHCAHCTAVYDGARNTVQLIGNDDVSELPPGFSERLFQRLAMEVCGR